MNNPYNSKLTTRCVHRATCASWIVLLLLALPAAVEAQFAYTINNGAVTITRYYGPGGAVTIPSTILGLPVTTIGEQAFLSCTNVTSVTIPNSVTSISYESFIFCTSLTNVTIANSVTLIGSGAFAYCTSLTEVTIPNSVTVLVGDAFASCSSLSAITVDSLNPAFSSIKGVLFNKSQTALVEFPAGKTGTYTVPNGVAYIGGGRSSTAAP